MPSEWVLFTLDAVLGIFPTKHEAVAQARITAGDRRARPLLHQFPDGLFMYSGPSDGRGPRRIFYLTNSPDALRRAGVAAEDVAAWKKRQKEVS